MSLKNIESQSHLPMPEDDKFREIREIQKSIYTGGDSRKFMFLLGLCGACLVIGLFMKCCFPIGVVLFFATLITMCLEATTDFLQLDPKKRYRCHPLFKEYVQAQRNKDAVMKKAEQERKDKLEQELRRKEIEERERRERYARDQRLKEEEKEKRRMELLESQNYWLKLSAQEFEHVIADLFVKAGYKDVNLTPPSGDGGVDIYFTNVAGQRTAVQCKRYSQPVRVEEVRAFYGAVMAEGISSAIFICTGGFTSGASEFCKKTNIEMMDLQAIISFARNK